METVVGPLGFIIPVQSLPASQEVTLTPKEVAAWCQALSIADLGTSAKKIYHVLSDCNKVKLKPNDRFAIMELLHAHVRIISRSLSKHFTNQSHKLSKHQLMIANLSQTLGLEMANGYKLIIEEGMSTEPSEIRPTILPAALEKIIHYNTGILFQNYQLYSLPPKGTWKELHLSFKLAEKHQLLTNNNLANDYKHTLLLAAADPYQWNQREQKSYFKAAKIWANLATIRKDLPNNVQSGFFIIDLNEDMPPTFPSRNLVKISASSQILDVNAILDRQKSILTAIEPNELKARISHNHEPEYGVSASMLKGLIKEWETSISRSNDRAARSESVRICVGFISTHYYLNNQIPFQSQQSNESNQNQMSNLPTLTVQEGNEDENSAVPEPNNILENTHDTEVTSLYPLYSCTLVNENSSGYGLLWPDDTFPPIQAGEIIAIERVKDTTQFWEICKIHWLQHQNPNEFRIGIERLSKTCKAGAAETMDDGKPSGYKLRCLLLESTLLVPILPFKSKTRILFTQPDDSLSIEIDLIDLVDSTGSYQQFSFNSKHLLKGSIPLSTTEPEPIPTSEIEQKKLGDDDESSEGFDSIWKNL